MNRPRAALPGRGSCEHFETQSLPPPFNQYDEVNDDVGGGGGSYSERQLDNMGESPKLTRFFYDFVLNCSGRGWGGSKVLNFRQECLFTCFYCTLGHLNHQSFKVFSFCFRVLDPSGESAF